MRDAHAIPPTAKWAHAYDQDHHAPSRPSPAAKDQAGEARHSREANLLARVDHGDALKLDVARWSQTARRCLGTVCLLQVGVAVVASGCRAEQEAPSEQRPPLCEGGKRGTTP